MEIIFIIIVLLVALFLAVQILTKLTGPNLEKKVSMAKEFEKSGKHQRAVEILTEVLKRQPNHMTAHYYLGVAYKGLKDYKYALAEFKILLNKKQFSSEIRFKEVHEHVAEIYRAQDNYKGALGEYLAILEKDKSDNVTKMKAAEMYNVLGAKDKAANLLKEIISGDPKNADALRTLGVILCETQKYKDALGFLIKARELDETNTETWFYLGKAKKALMDYEGAYEAFEKAKANKAYRLSCLINMGESLENQGRYPEAITILKEAVNTKSDNHNLLNHARYKLADLFLKTKDVDDAINLWKQILSIDEAFKDVQEKLKAYEGLISDDTIKDFFIASYPEFVMTVKKLVEKLDYTINSTKKASEDMMVVYASKKGLSKQEKSILYFIRTNDPIQLDVLKELQDELALKNTRKGMIVTTSVFAPSVLDECQNTSIILYDKTKLSELLSTL